MYYATKGVPIACVRQFSVVLQETRMRMEMSFLERDRNYDSVLKIPYFLIERNNVQKG